jgi:nucleotide sugar dehydrogenase
MKITVVGMGKIGLPLAVQYAKKGNTVTGIDINPKTVDFINQGLEPFPGEAHLKEYLSDVVGKGQLDATLDYEMGVKSADVVVVVVPLFVNNKAEPEFSAMDQATALIGANLKKGTLICYETTLPIGTTRTRFVPSLEKHSGLKVGIDFNVVFSPERVFTGRIFEDLKKYPKIIGGITQDCTNRGVIFYTQVLDFDKRDDLTKPNGVWAVESAESAEFVKLAETSYRDVNIALANQFAMYADKIGVNIYEVIHAANSQKFSFLHQPGISVGGHCIPIYPQFYLWSDPKASMVKKARETNSQMPTYFINEILKRFNTLKNLKVLILGISYRAFAIDPFYTKSEINEIGFEYGGDLSQPYDVVVLHTDHQEFSEIDFSKFQKGAILLDGRNFYIKEKVTSQIDLFKFGNVTK